MALSLAKSTFFSNPTSYFPKNGIRSFGFLVPFSSFSTSSPFPAVDGVHGHKKRQSSVVASALDLGGVKISKDGQFTYVSLFLCVLTLVFILHDVGFVKFEFL